MSAEQWVYKAIQNLFEQRGSVYDAAPGPKYRAQYIEDYERPGWYVTWGEKRQRERVIGPTLEEQASHISTQLNMATYGSHRRDPHTERNRLACIAEAGVVAANTLAAWDEEREREQQEATQ